MVEINSPTPFFSLAKKKQLIMDLWSTDAPRDQAVYSKLAGQYGKCHKVTCFKYEVCISHGRKAIAKVNICLLQSPRGHYLDAPKFYPDAKQILKSLNKLLLSEKKV